MERLGDAMALLIEQQKVSLQKQEETNNLMRELLLSKDLPKNKTAKKEILTGTKVVRVNVEKLTYPKYLGLD
jgi:hypothetical protein